MDEQTIIVRQTFRQMAKAVIGFTKPIILEAMSIDKSDVEKYSKLIEYNAYHDLTNKTITISFDVQLGEIIFNKRYIFNYFRDNHKFCCIIPHNFIHP